MRVRISYIFILICLVFIGKIKLVAQPFKTADDVLKSTLPDTSKCTILGEMVEAEPDELIWPQINIKFKQLAEKNLSSLKKGDALYQFYSMKLAAALNNEGLAFSRAGKNKEAMEDYEKAKQLFEQWKDKDGLASYYNNMAMILGDLGDVQKGLEYYSAALKLYEEAGNDRGVSYSLINMGYLYGVVKDHESALKYYEMAVPALLKMRDSIGVGSAYMNIAAVYLNLNKTKEAIHYHHLCCGLFKKMGYEYGLGNVYGAIGQLYASRGFPGCKERLDLCIKKSFDSTMYYLNLSFAIREKQNIPDEMATALYNIAGALSEVGKVKEALPYAQRSYSLHTQLGYPGGISLSAFMLYRIYLNNGDLKAAYEMQKVYRKMKDSISNDNNKKIALQRSVEYEYSKRVLADSVSNVQRVKVIEAEVRHQKIEKNFLFAGIGFVFLLTAFIYNRLRLIRRQKQLIESQKTEMETQRNIIEKRSAEIFDSIHYAKRIQLAQLPTESAIKRTMERFLGRK